MRESFQRRVCYQPASSKDEHPEYGPFAISAGRQRIMRTSSGGFRPTEAAHIRDSAMCGTCHTLITRALALAARRSAPFRSKCLTWNGCTATIRARAPANRVICRKVHGQVSISAVLGVPREGMRRHTFVAANFFMLKMLNLYVTISVSRRCLRK